MSDPLLLTVGAGPAFRNKNKLRLPRSPCPVCGDRAGDWTLAQSSNLRGVKVPAPSVALRAGSVAKGAARAGHLDGWGSRALPGPNSQREQGRR
jgi:hypothetical protein